MYCSVYITANCVNDSIKCVTNGIIINADGTSNIFESFYYNACLVGEVLTLRTKNCNSTYNGYESGREGLITEVLTTETVSFIIGEAFFRLYSELFNFILNTCPVKIRGLCSSK